MSWTVVPTTNTDIIKHHSLESLLISTQWTALIYQIVKVDLKLLLLNSSQPIAAFFKSTDLDQDVKSTNIYSIDCLKLDENAIIHRKLQINTNYPREVTTDESELFKT